MSLVWVHENPPTWDDDKARIIMGAEPGIFDDRYGHLTHGTLIPGEWWRVEDDGRVVGYGWLDSVFGNAEILLATASDARGQGVGTFVLDRLSEEAKARGLNYLYNVVRPTHPEPEELRSWLMARGFEGRDDGRLLKRSTGLRRSEQPSPA
jgi:GNAT superfamily N-acetyltransferase